MHAIRTEDEEATPCSTPDDPNCKAWTIWRRSESKLGKGKPLVRIQKEDPQLGDLEWTEDEQAKLKTIVE
jgi:hypothetical protein